MSVGSGPADTGPAKLDARGGLLAIEVQPRAGQRANAAVAAFVPFHPGDIIQGAVWMRCTKPDTILRISIHIFTEETASITRRRPGGKADLGAASLIKMSKTKRFFDHASLMLGSRADYAELAQPTAPPAPAAADAGDSAPSRGVNADPSVATQVSPPPSHEAPASAATASSGPPAGWTPVRGKLYSLPFVLALPTLGQAMTSVHVKTGTGRATIGTYLQVVVNSESQTVMKIIEIPVVNLIRLGRDYYPADTSSHSGHFSSCFGGSFGTHLFFNSKPNASFTYSEVAKFSTSPIGSATQDNTGRHKINYKSFKVKARLKRVITFAAGHFKDSAELYSDFVPGIWHLEEICWKFELPLQFDEGEIDTHSTQAIHTLHANFIHVKFFIEINYKGWFRAWNVNSEIFVGNVHERNVTTGILPVQYVPTGDAKGATVNFRADAESGGLPLPALNQNVDFDAIEKAANLPTVVEIYIDDALKSALVMHPKVGSCVPATDVVNVELEP